MSSCVSAFIRWRAHPQIAHRGSGGDVRHPRSFGSLRRALAARHLWRRRARAGALSAWPGAQARFVPVAVSAGNGVAPRLVREELMKIIYWKPKNDKFGVAEPLANERVEAEKSIVMLDLALLNAEIANGMHRKPIDAVAREFRCDAMPGEVRLASCPQDVDARQKAAQGRA